MAAKASKSAGQFGGTAVAQVPLKDLVADLLGGGKAVAGEASTPAHAKTEEGGGAGSDFADPTATNSSQPAGVHSVTADPTALLSPVDASAFTMSHAAQPAPHATASSTVAADAAAASVVPADDNAARNTQRLAAMVHATLGQGRSVARMQLQPPELGAVTAVVQLRQNKMDLRLEVASEAARDLVTGGLERLRDALQEQGISLDRATVSVAPRNEHSSGDQQQSDWPGQQNHASGQFHPGQGGQQGERGLTTSFAVDLPAEAVATQADPAAAGVLHAAGLNVLA